MLILAFSVGYKVESERQLRSHKGYEANRLILSKDNVSIDV